MNGIALHLSRWIPLHSVVQRLLFGEEGDHPWTPLQRMGTMVSTHLSSPMPSSTRLLLMASTDALMSALWLTPAIGVVWRCYCHFWKLLLFLNSTFSWFSFYLSSLSFLVSLAGSSSSVHLLMLLFIIGPFPFPLALSGRSHPFPCLRMITNNQ